MRTIGGREASSSKKSQPIGESATNKNKGTYKRKKNGLNSGRRRNNKKTPICRKGDFGFKFTTGSNKIINLEFLNYFRSSGINKLIETVYENFNCLTSDVGIEQRINALYPDIERKQYNFAQLCILLTASGVNKNSIEYSLTKLYKCTKILIKQYILIKCVPDTVTTTDTQITSVDGVNPNNFWSQVDLKLLSLGTLIHYAAGKKYLNYHQIKI